MSEGLQMVSNTTGANSTISVACNATHLTSFAVLVDVAGGHEVQQSYAEIIYVL